MMEKNELYPVFLKTHELNVLIVGGGNVAFEKLSFLLKSSPNARVKVLAPMFRQEVLALAAQYNVELIAQPYHISYLDERHLVIVTTDDHEVNLSVYKDCKAKHLLVNVADTPELCDFYLGGIVTKGNIKIAISTNGKSPTIAKRIRQFLEEIIPDEIDDLVKNLNEFRKGIKGDFATKVNKLNRLTKGLISHE